MQTIGKVVNLQQYQQNVLYYLYLI